MRSREQIKEGPQDFNLSDDECSPVDSESVHSFQIPVGGEIIPESTGRGAKFEGSHRIQ